MEAEAMLERSVIVIARILRWPHGTVRPSWGHIFPRSPTPTAARSPAAVRQTPCDRGLVDRPDPEDPDRIDRAVDDGRGRPTVGRAAIDDAVDGLAQLVGDLGGVARRRQARQ